jgi:HD-GYP domain-containing protein (c-di-GMP phosphodiesterase class II)
MMNTSGVANPRFALPFRRLHIAVAAVGLVVPLAAFISFMAKPGWDQAFGSGPSHFYIVSLAAGISLVLALAVIWAARRLPDSRTFFLAMAFMSMATIFLAHGLGTSPWFGGHSSHAAADPFAAYGAIAQPTAPAGEHVHAAAAPAVAAPAFDFTTTKAFLRLRVVGYSARLSLLVGSMFLALSVVELRPRAADLFVRHFRKLVAAFSLVFAIHVATALAYPNLISWLPLEEPAVSWGVGAVAWSCLGFAGWRYYQAYRLALLPLQGTMALGILLLAEAQLMMITGRLWHLSWWTYHVVMLVGFAGPVLALLHQYRTTGDLGVLIEGLFLREQIKGLRKNDPAALTTLAAAVSGKDGETAGHLERVGELAVAIGLEMGLPAERMATLRWGGRLHDLGKIGVPNSILRKPGKLTAAEFAIMKDHTVRGWNVALRCPALVAAAPIIRSHHEKVNGSGYPDGLVGDAIPIEARIVAVADVWDALTWARPYKPAWPVIEAISLLRRDSGSHFDSDCVDALFGVLEFDQPAQLPRAA